ncbi:MAG: Asp-tRNA(Asn)/Glu-tRNA(Gln) amidotransferase subunit GatB [Candidatus Colwellbacteria bacterium CG10_big_fil_rev_8_21_14_0_10_41_28]|uniref:Aspartyl/glutamyl-tRNA(Asn/Gln) amidotransferase subunit B n=1 Tax=Candidatus Colwellbacteria bacterium CG10_big_fil_rev_8_21_14_0_10_41_28 TaxID=1974539 RepID=A0A2H0VHK7_9BACT|nr:MAG: Asp-tRNA(Asn)/Glu-tRNA(Gln) amidotransferase subunit GatB [Candidatus Colwellbacteria bacterium CG10_big_fil_rev_8_21_14_0_10_41_28]
MKYVPTIGLEIHAELKTKTKMFCDCLNIPDEIEPNKNVCPICLAEPGTLPVPNKEAIRAMIKIGLSLGGTIAERSKFDRKSYFYPDLPKGYQISQYDMPIVSGGSLKGVQIERVHLEEDTARSTHENGESLVDFNRAGLPLMELVTKPVIKTAEQAYDFARELQLLLRYLNVSDADMEKGQMRVEANISIAPKKLFGNKKLGTKVELKNINSFKAVKAAIENEIERQEALIKGGGKVIQSTRGWDEVAGKSFPQRIKEEANDYRYMPEPDIPPLDLTAKDIFDMDEIRRSIPELPDQKRIRFSEEFGLSGMELEHLITDRDLSGYFEESISELKALIQQDNSIDEESAKKTLYNYLTSDLVGLIKEQGVDVSDLKIKPEDFAELVVLIEKKEVLSRTAKDILIEMFRTGIDPHEIIDHHSLGQAEDGEVQSSIMGAISENPKAVEEYKNGKEAVIKFLVGQSMSKLRGRGNPEQLEQLLKDHLSK